MAARKYWVYMLRCADDSLYTGYTVDLRRRLGAHNSGSGSKYTAARLPVRLAFVEEAVDQGSALRREHEIKELSRAEKLALCRRQTGRKKLSFR